MRIAILSDPDNFHTRKWVRALVEAGGEVQVFSFDSCSHQDFPSKQLPLPAVCGGKLSYLAYLFGGKTLRSALHAANIDVVLALNVTPFGVWARQSGFHPWVVVAMGADILEFLPANQLPEGLEQRSWDNVEGEGTGWTALKARFSRPFYRMQVRRSLLAADHITADNQVLVDAMQTGFGINPSKITLNRWGIDPQLLSPDPAAAEKLRIRLGIPEGKKVILSPRGLKAVYNADIIAEGYIQFVRAGNLDCCMVMLGAGYPVSEKILSLRKEAEAAGGTLIIVEDLLTAEEMGQIWCLSDIFISAPVYDGYSSALAEGRYVGAIPMVNAIPGNLELIRHGENGWVCSPFTPQQLAIDLEAIIPDLSDLKQKFAGINRKWIEENGVIAPNATRMLELLTRILGHS